MSRHHHYQPPVPTDPLDLFVSQLESPPGPPPPSHRDGPVTERLAAEKVRPVTGKIRRRLVAFALLQGAEGLTPDEACADQPERTPYSVRPRVTELASAAWGKVLVETTRMRPNRRGNLEMVYVHRDFA